jgi:hypothetical protein
MVASSRPAGATVSVCQVSARTPVRLGLVISWLAYTVVALCGVAIIWGLITAAADKPPGKAQLLFAAFLELVVVVQTVIASVQLVLGFRPAEFATTIGYLIGIVILIPVAWFWANSERTRFSGVVLAVAALAVLGMTLRLLMLWVPPVLR